MVALFNSETDLRMVVSPVRDGVRPVELSGNLDFSTVERARLELLDLMPGTPVLALNAAGLSFCDAAGLRLLVQLHDHAKTSGCRVIICAASPAVDWLLRLTDLTVAFDYPPVEPSACDDLPRPKETHGMPT